jgi:hypothetical protein
MQNDNGRIRLEQVLAGGIHGASGKWQLDWAAASQHDKTIFG